MKDKREGFEVETELVEKVGKRVFKQPFSIKVDSLNPNDIQLVIDFWRNHFREKNDPRKIVVKNIYRIEKVLISLK